MIYLITILAAPIIALTIGYLYGRNQADPEEIPDYYYL